MKNVEEALQAGRRIAAGYDFWPWEEEVPPDILPANVKALAQPYGARDDLSDVLDLGCGTGDLLLLCSEQGGRLVGTDISAVSCAMAAEKVAPLGERATVITADLLELTAERLGQFDLIYCIGVLYSLPPAVRLHALRLIGQCLKPGGMAVMSYYVGLDAALRAKIAQTLRAETDHIEEPRERVREGRNVIDRIRVAAAVPTQYALGLRRNIHFIDGMSDEYFFAEVLSGEFQSVSTAEIGAVLAADGAEFATYLHYSGFEPWYSGKDRSLLADRLDLTGGEYRFALFLKPIGERPNAPQGGRAAPGNEELPQPSPKRMLTLRMRARRLARLLFWHLFKL